MSSDLDGTRVHLIASPDTWIEGEAVRQLEQTARLPGMRAAVGLPDLHPGKGYPIGAAFLSELVYPALVGNDIGCGMGLWQTDQAMRKFRSERAAERLSGLEGPWDGDLDSWRAEQGLASTAFDQALGTIGGGNHFAEVQALAEVLDATAVAALNLDPERLLLLIHSGSRGLGESVLRTVIDQHGHQGAPGADLQGSPPRWPTDAKTPWRAQAQAGAPMSTPTLWLQVSAGRCPEECEWVVGQLAPRLSAELQARGLAVEEIDRAPGRHAGNARSVLLRVSGENVHTQVDDWLGTIQWIGVSPYRPHHKRKNWWRKGKAKRAERLRTNAGDRIPESSAGMPCGFIGERIFGAKGENCLPSTSVIALASTETTECQNPDENDGTCVDPT